MSLKYGADLQPGDIIITRGVGDTPDAPHMVEQIWHLGDEMTILWDDGVLSPLALDAHILTEDT